MNNFKVINSNTIIRDLEEENKKLKNKIKVLQSKVKTYEADILKGAYDNNNYVYRDNCYCVKCEQQRLEANRKKLRAANDLKGTTKLF